MWDRWHQPSPRIATLDQSDLTHELIGRSRVCERSWAHGQELRPTSSSSPWWWRSIARCLRMIESRDPVFVIPRADVLQRDRFRRQEC